MDFKVRPPDSFNPGDVAPLPSAPPPSYDDAMGTSTSSGGHGIQHSVPLMTAKEGYPPSQPIPPYPVQPVIPQPLAQYPVQQVQTAPVGSVLPTSRYLPVGRHPLKTTCTGCNTYISTKIKSKNNCHPTFWCIVLFMTGICTLCSCCPYFCCDKLYRVDHFCPQCNAFLGTYVDAS